MCRFKFRRYTRNIKYKYKTYEMVRDMCNTENTNLCKLGLNKSTSVSNAQYLCAKLNIVIKA